jgi:hypothetical protein
VEYGPHFQENTGVSHHGALQHQPLVLVGQDWVHGILFQTYDVANVAVALSKHDDQMVPGLEL